MLPGVVGAKRGRKTKAAVSEAARGGRQRLGLIVFAAVFVVLFVVFAVAQGVGSPSVPSGDAALVQSVPAEVGQISEKDFEAALKQQVAQGKLKKTPAPGSKKYEELTNAAIGELLQAVWIKGEAEEREIEVTPKQIETELASIKKQNFPTPAAYQKFLKESGFTEEQVNDRVELQILSGQVQKAVAAEAPTPTEGDIKAYYEAEKEAQFTTKESRDVRVITNKNKKKLEEAKAALEKDNSPASWKKVAPKYSENPATVKNGGLQKGITEEFLEGPVKKAIFGSATGELVGPVKFQQSWLLAEVVKLNPEETKKFSEVKSQIGQTLAQEKQQEFFSGFIQGWESKWRSRSYCASSITDAVTESKIRDELAAKCGNVTPSGRPASANPACYEANPKTPAKECPAPVTPTSVALPGTVTEQKPKGEPFQQRPIPESFGSEAEAAEVPGATPPPSGE